MHDAPLTRESEAMPPLFLSHGSPMIALQPREAGHFMQRLGRVLVTRFGRPAAVLAISAHTLTRAPAFFAAPRHAAVYDFGGFAEELYRLRYDAPGAPALATQAHQLLAAAGVESQVVPGGGLDHGIWTALRYLLPDADVPVLPLGWPPAASPEQLMSWGRALSPLAAQGVLIVGTGSITHNLRRVFARGRDQADQPVTPESAAFRDWFAARAAARDWAALAAWRAQAPHALLMHPTDEHLLPWFVAAGAGGPEAPGLRIHASQTHGDLGMDAYAFGPLAAALDDALRAAVATRAGG